MAGTRARGGRRRRRALGALRQSRRLSVTSSTTALSVLDTLSAYQVHLFESSVAPEGAIATAAWVDYWRELHRGFNASRADVWDAYMWNSQTFYVRLFVRFVSFFLRSRDLRDNQTFFFAAVTVARVVVAAGVGRRTLSSAAALAAAGGGVVAAAASSRARIRMRLAARRSRVRRRP